MIAHAKRLTKSKFARNVAIVASGTAGAQAITMAFSPIITRLYGPEAFGVLGTFTAILAVLTPLAALSYPIAIVLPKRDADALGLAKLSLGIALAMSLLAALMLTLFKAPIVNAFNLEAVESFILLLPLAMLFSAAMAVMSQWVIRKKLFKIKAKVAVLQALWLNTAKAGIGLFSPLAAVLVVLATVGSALHALMLWLSVRRSDAPVTFISSINVLKAQDDTQTFNYKFLGWKYRDFLYYRTPQGVINSISQSMPLLIFASFFGPAVAGFYALSKLVLAAPSALIGQAVASVFYPRINEAILNNEEPYPLLWKATLLLAAVGVMPFGFFVLFGPWFFVIAFGEEWESSGVFAQWLALWTYAGFINRPSMAAIPVFNYQGLFLFYEVVSVFVRIIALALGWVVYESSVVAVALLSVVGAALNLSLILFVLLKSYKMNSQSAMT